jgi:hypothetical protein
VPPLAVQAPPVASVETTIRSVEPTATHAPGTMLLRPCEHELFVKPAAVVAHAVPAGASHVQGVHPRVSVTES